MKKIVSISSLILSLFLMTACDSMENPPDIADTKYNGDASGLGTPQDLIDNQQAGLEERGLNGASNFDPENINPADIVSTIYFGFNQYAISAAERENVKKAAEFFKNNPNMKVVLVGHTDWYGTEEYNTLLSDKRCKAVADYMIGVGTDASNVETIGRGEKGATVDVAKDSAEAKKDRRVDIVKQK